MTRLSESRFEFLGIRDGVAMRMTELEILHGWRRSLQRSKRLGLPDWSEEELAWVRRCIDELELLELGLVWWRNELLFRMRVRVSDLAMAEARRLLGSDSG
jgi:hypothetical protein